MKTERYSDVNRLERTWEIVEPMLPGAVFTEVNRGLNSFYDRGINALPSTSNWDNVRNDAREISKSVSKLAAYGAEITTYGPAIAGAIELSQGNVLYGLLGFALSAIGRFGARRLSQDLINLGETEKL